MQHAKARKDKRKTGIIYKYLKASCRGFNLAVANIWSVGTDIISRPHRENERRTRQEILSQEG